MHALTAPATVTAVAASAERPFRVQHAAGLASRSSDRRPSSRAGTSCSRARSPAIRNRHGTFDDVIGRLPDIRADGLRRALLPADPSDRHEEPQGPQQHADARRRTISAAPTRSAAAEGGHDAIHPRARHARGFPPPGRGRARARPRDRARLRDPVLAGPSVAARSSGLVQLAARTARSNTPRTRRRSTRTSSTSTSTATMRAGAVDRAARRRAVLGRRGRAHLPRRQSAHQAAAVLAMDDRRRARGAIRT